MGHVFWNQILSMKPHGFTRIQCLLDALRVPDDELEAAIDACKAQLEPGDPFVWLVGICWGVGMFGFAYVEGDVLKSTGFFMLSRENRKQEVVASLSSVERWNICIRANL